MAQRLSFSFLMACRFGILLFITATLLQFFSVSAAEYHQSSAAGVPGTTHIDYYLRGKMNGAATEEGRQAEWQHDLLLQAGRQLTEESSSSEAESVEVADYTPCANFRHDPSVCSPP